LAGGQKRRDFEIGRILHLKSEIRNLQLDRRFFQSRPVQSDISDFGFEMQDSSNFKISSPSSFTFSFEAEHFLDGLRVQDTVLLDPTALRSGDTIRKV